MLLENNIGSEISIVQLAHGRVIPYYSSAYSMRCNSLLENMPNHKIISVGGPVFRDENNGVAFQFHSILLTGISVVKGKRSFEIMVSRGRFLRKRFIKYAKREIERSKVVVFEGPWHFETFKSLLKDRIVIYDAHNVEFILRNGNIFQNFVKEIEGDLAERADGIFCVTKSDMNVFSKIYSIPPEKLFLLPHYQIKVGRTWQGLETRNAVFIGSVYSPNIDALDSIKQMAARVPDVSFHVLGNFPKFYRRGSPKNVIFDGEVNDAKKEEIICNSFVALNPVVEGGGRNLKMIDYMAHGVPIISTKIGCRGLYEYGIEKIIDISEPEGFAERIIALKNEKERMLRESGLLLDAYQKLVKVESSKDSVSVLKEIIQRKNKQDRDNH